MHLKNVKRKVSSAPLTQKQAVFWCGGELYPGAGLGRL